MDPERARGLRTAKRRATALLVFAAAVYVVARLAEADHEGLGYLRATAEAAMVGGLADWFAVTALFRHPLGVPIPHTAIVPRGKDQLGRSLGGFVEEHFLAPELVTERLRSAQPAARLGEWLADPRNVTLVGEQAGAVLRGTVEVLDDDEVQLGLEQLLVERLRLLPIAPIVGRSVQIAVDGGHHQVLFDSALSGLERFLVENRQTLRDRMDRESPWWVPGPIDDRIFEKIFDGVRRFVADVGGEPDHELRRELDRRVRELAERLKSSPELHERAEALKTELLDHPEMRAWMGSLWMNVERAVVDASHDPTSTLRVQIERALASFGASLRTDPALRAKVDHWLAGAVGYLVEQVRPEVSELISVTVSRWDGDQTSRVIEAQVGRDLQFIRINGTLVGGLCGLVIHTIGELLV